MTVPSALSPISLAQFFYQSGQLVRPARLFFYKPGTTEDPVVVYTDPGLTVPHPQPVVSGGSGRVPPVYVGVEPYRVRVYDSRGSHVEDIDYLPGAVDPNPGEEGSVLTPAEQQSLLKTGDFIWTFHTSDATRPGFVRANGGLIGPPGFAGSAGQQVEMLHADAHALFVWLWGQDSSNVLEMIPSRGASAEGDWAANKAIRLPDLCGRTLYGLETMGGPYKGRLTGVATTPPAGAVPGAYGGAATATLTAAQMPSHSHTVAYAAAGISATAAASSQVTLAAAVANLSYAATGVSVQYAASRITATDSGHGHALPANLAPDGDGAFHNSLFTGAFRGFTNTGYANITINDPQHFHNINDPTHIHAQTPHGHTLTDLTHYHGINDPTHTHTLSAAGGGAATPTVGPFLTATCFIKL